jgi:hypothetical protein
VFAFTTYEREGREVSRLLCVELYTERERKSKLVRASSVYVMCKGVAAVGVGSSSSSNNYNSHHHNGSSSSRLHLQLYAFA